MHISGEWGKSVYLGMDTELSEDQRFELVCEELEKGIALRTIFMRPNKPMSNTLFYRLLNERPDLNERYARAKEVYAADMFDEIIEISDESNADIEFVEGKMIINGEAVNRSRLRVDARKWILSKLEPKKYGDKSAVEHTIIEQPLFGDNNE